MVESMVESLRRDLECESLFDCIHGLKDLDRECFRVLVESNDALTVDDIATAVDRERSTAYRAVQRLLDNGLIRKEQINYDQGSYYHVYYPEDPDVIADEMQRTLNDWYAKMGQLVHEFRGKYGEKIEQPVPADD